MPRGKLIVLEGADASGKGTQAKQISKYFLENNLSYDYFHFPMYGHNQFSELIAMFLRGEFGNVDEVDPLFVANIYAMDRFRFLPELEKALENKDVVLLDRYVYSNIAYQCAKFENKIDRQRMREWIHGFEFGFLNLPYPDLNLFLDVPIQVTRKRLEQQKDRKDREYLQGKEDIHEVNLDFQKRVRENYLISMEGGVNCKIIPCVIQPITPEEIFASYVKYLDYVLFNNPLKYE